MGADMGTFRVDIEIENPALPGVKQPLNLKVEPVTKLLVDAAWRSSCS